MGEGDAAKRRTILDAVVQVLAEAGEPRSLHEIHRDIIARGLYSFRAKDAVGVIRGTIRKHLRDRDKAPADVRVEVVGRDSFALAGRGAPSV